MGLVQEAMTRVWRSGGLRGGGPSSQEKYRRGLGWSMQPRRWEGNLGLDTLRLPSSLSLPLISC